MKPFYKSRKFIYALGTLIAALIVALLPAGAEAVGQTLSPETLAMLEKMLPLVIVLGLSALAGHTVTDLMALWTEGVQAKNLKQAIIDLIEEIDLAEADEIVPEPSPPGPFPPLGGPPE